MLVKESFASEKLTLQNASFGSNGWNQHYYNTRAIYVWQTQDRFDRILSLVNCGFNPTFWNFSAKDRLSTLMSPDSRRKLQNKDESTSK